MDCSSVFSGEHRRSRRAERKNMVRGKSVKEGVPLPRASLVCGRRSPVRVDLHYTLELLAVAAKQKRGVASRWAPVCETVYIPAERCGGARSSVAASQRTPGSRYSLQDGKSAAGRMGYRWRHGPLPGHAYMLPDRFGRVSSSDERPMIGKKTKPILQAKVRTQI
jgi:hypothetical protein